MLTLGLARGRRGPAATVITVSALVVLMILLSPVCHLHYFCLCAPLVMGWLAAHWQVRGDAAAGWGAGLLLAAYAAANALPHLPVFQLLRDCGLATYAALVLWLVGVVALRAGERPTAGAAPLETAA